MSKRLAVAKAKASFSACLRMAETGATVLITRHGKAVAALVPADTAGALMRLRAAGPEGGLASLAGGWEGSDDFVRNVRKARRRGSRRSTLGE